MENVYNAIFDNIIPKIWNKFSYLSDKKLSSYLVDLIKRIENL